MGRYMSDLGAAVQGLGGAEGVAGLATNDLKYGADQWTSATLA